jgi:hypothetical protein
VEQTARLTMEEEQVLMRYHKECMEELGDNSIVEPVEDDDQTSTDEPGAYKFVTGRQGAC